MKHIPKKVAPSGQPRKAASQQLNVPVGYGYLPYIPDQLSDQYAHLLSGTYDCVDRIILDAYFSQGIDDGDFRCWWRALHGSDENLDNAH